MSRSLKLAAICAVFLAGCVPLRLMPAPTTVFRTLSLVGNSGGSDVSGTFDFQHFHDFPISLSFI